LEGGYKTRLAKKLEEWRKQYSVNVNNQIPQNPDRIPIARLEPKIISRGLNTLSNNGAGKQLMQYRRFPNHLE